MDVGPFSTKEKPERKTPHIVYIEGNISCGKTTVIELLRQQGYNVFEEPIDDWHQYTENGKNMLELFYTDMKKYGFGFEFVVLMSRYKQLLRALSVVDNGIVIVERSLLTDRKIFARNLFIEGTISQLEWKIYQDWHDMFMAMVNTMHVVKSTYIYIRVAPDDCYLRKIGRDRKEEEDATPEYFYSLHSRHEEWLAANKHIIDGCQKPEQVMNQVVKVISGII